ncbi:MAG: aldehyde ferredoxin oxidoreductase N-terminal domain-containing protein [Dehalococcoidia bacterium]
MAQFGYAGQTLKVNLSTGAMERIPTDYYAERFIGGRGLAAKVHWDEVNPGTPALSPENLLSFTTGPLAGFTRLAGSRWQVCGKSPVTVPESFSYANAGGSWGAWLKFSGFDAIMVRGRAEHPVYIFLHDGEAEIRNAQHLHGKSAIETRQTLKEELGKEVRVAATGPAGENLVPFATVLADEDSSASGGFGAVMGSKNLKAIAVAGKERPVAARPDDLKDLVDQILRLRKGTYDIYTPAIPGKTRRRACYGCISGCTRETFTSSAGEEGKFFCQSANVYRRPAMKYSRESSEVIFRANRLCDHYGLDTAVIEPMIEWLARCQQEGILSESEAGLPLSAIGSQEFIEALIPMIALRQGFGEILARGTIQAAEQIGKEAMDALGDLVASRANEVRTYDPRLYNITALLWATEPRRPIQQLHEVSLAIMEWVYWRKEGKDAFMSGDVFRRMAERFWGSGEAADFTSLEGVAMASKRIQDRTCAKESLVLCDFLWPIIWVRYGSENVGDPSMESKVFSAVTGIETSQEELEQLGERIFNLQRAILVCEGRGGREGDTLLDYFHHAPLESEHLNRRLIVPDSTGQAITMKGNILSREDYEALRTEYYRLRGWDEASGLQTRHRLEELDLNDVNAHLNERRLLA